jgi:hypothetical protein
MKLPARMSWHDAATVLLVLVTAALFVVCAFLAATNF